MKRGLVENKSRMKIGGPTSEINLDCISNAWIWEDSNCFSYGSILYVDNNYFSSIASSFLSHSKNIEMRNCFYVEATLRNHRWIKLIISISEKLMTRCCPSGGSYIYQ